MEVAIEERDHTRRIATLSANMLNEVVAMLWGIMKLMNQRDSVRVNKSKCMTFCCGIWPMICINAK